MLKFKRTIAYFITVFMVLLSFYVPSFTAKADTNEITIGMNESEPNNSASNATSIPLNYDYTKGIAGSIECTGDEDYYKYSSVFNMPGHLLNCNKYIDKTKSPNVACSVVEDESNVGSPDSVPYSYSANELIKSIDNGYPILTTIDHGGSVCHCVAVKGYKEDCNGLNVIYNDPLDGEEHIVPFSHLSIVSYETFYPHDADLEPNDTTFDPIFFNSAPIQASIGKPGDVDFYSFAAQVPADYVIETTGTTDTYGELYDENGQLIASADNGGQGSNFKLQCKLDYRHSYYIKVSSKGNSTGSYTITKSFITPTN